MVSKYNSSMLYYIVNLSYLENMENLPTSKGQKFNELLKFFTDEDYTR